jgi:hypothetical protein
MIFPGMDPYLEDQRLWRGMQQALVVYGSEMLTPQLKRRAFADINERRRYQPLEYCELFIQLVETQEKRRVLTVIEFIAPPDKVKGFIRDQYLEHQ